MNHQDNRQGTDEKLAQEAEKYRDSVSKGGHGAHKPCEKFPLEEAQEADVQDEHKAQLERKK
jgi:hypothetical protein